MSSFAQLGAQPRNTDGGEIALRSADDGTSSAAWSELGIDPQSFGGMSVDDVRRRPPDPKWN